MAALRRLWAKWAIADIDWEWMAEVEAMARLVQPSDLDIADAMDYALDTSQVVYPSAAMIAEWTGRPLHEVQDSMARLQAAKIVVNTASSGEPKLTLTPLAHPRDLQGRGSLLLVGLRLELSRMRQRERLRTNESVYWGYDQRRVGESLSDDEK